MKFARRLVHRVFPGSLIAFDGRMTGVGKFAQLAAWPGSLAVDQQHGVTQAHRIVQVPARQRRWHTVDNLGIGIEGDPGLRLFKVGKPVGQQAIKDFFQQGRE
ncbi:hypothetical protein [Pseudomonas sp. P9(2020)]|uniref:hypothetical protein n=1 Tax=Pseudomonas sp. P9(2020) TaxID=2763316 RepID=UPI001E52C57C|nr:hypothetical protein [Pseudomonas sp. P9(2020)]